MFYPNPTLKNVFLVLYCFTHELCIFLFISYELWIFSYFSDELCIFCYFFHELCIILYMSHQLCIFSYFSHERNAHVVNKNLTPLNMTGHGASTHISVDQSVGDVVS